MKIYVQFEYEKCSTCGVACSVIEPVHLHRSVDALQQFLSGMVASGTDKVVCDSCHNRAIAKAKGEEVKGS